MKITVFTSNQPRHNYLINELSKIASKLFVIQEVKTIFPGMLNSHYIPSKIKHNYFKKVINAEKNIFKNKHINISNNLSYLSIQLGDLNFIKLSSIKSFLNSDIYIIFGSSYIKSELIDFLIKNKAINIHMGVSPYYKGTDCNFWSMYDQNYNLTGATIHLINKNLDSGPILYHAMSEKFDNPFIYSMSTVKSAVDSLVNKIFDNSIFKIKPTIQRKNKLIRYSKKNQFTDEIIIKFLKKDFRFQKINKNKLISPYILKK